MEVDFDGDAVLDGSPVRNAEKGESENFGDRLVSFLRSQSQKPPARKEAAYWCIFFAASIFFTGMILRFVDSYEKDMERYQSSLTSVGRYDSFSRETGNATAESTSVFGAEKL
jgi:hypothetical protein